MKRGTIILAPFPFTDLKSVKRRPAIIISKDDPNNKDVLIAFISSKVPSLPKETEFLLTKNHKDFLQTGLIKDSLFKLDKLVTIQKEIINGELGSASEIIMNEINKKLMIALDLK